MDIVASTLSRLRNDQGVGDFGILVINLMY